MKFLTFDTALNKTYISLGEDNSFTELLTIENSEDKYHSAFLIQEIANILNISQTRISVILKCITKKIRFELVNCGLLEENYLVKLENVKREKKNLVKKV